jgi:hypothetical protein
MGSLLTKPSRDDPRITIKQLLKECRTGDIILFSGNSIFSCMVRCVSNSDPWSHVSVVYKRDDASRPLMFESTYDTGEIPDLFSNE